MPSASARRRFSERSSATRDEGPRTRRDALPRPCARRCLLEQGHEPTLFNRGLTHAELFPDVEKLRGDRRADLSALEGRDWDAVLDVAAYFPDEARRSVDVLPQRARRYVFVSSVSVYADHSVPQVEGAAVAELSPGRRDGRRAGDVRRAQGRVRADRRGGVRGSGARRPAWSHRRPVGSDRPIHVLAASVARGGEVLAPASPDYAVQFIDVRDLAGWIGQGGRGGPRRDVQRHRRDDGLGDLLAECIRVTRSDARLVWVPSDRLLEAGAEEWMGVPLWIAPPAGRPSTGFPLTRRSRRD